MCDVLINSGSCTPIGRKSSVFFSRHASGDNYLGFSDVHHNAQRSNRNRSPTQKRGSSASWPIPHKEPLAAVTVATAPQATLLPVSPVMRPANYYKRPPPHPLIIMSSPLFQVDRKLPISPVSPILTHLPSPSPVLRRNAKKSTFSKSMDMVYKSPCLSRSKSFAELLNGCTPAIPLVKDTTLPQQPMDNNFGIPSPPHSLDVRILRTKHNYSSLSSKNGRCLSPSSMFMSEPIPEKQKLYNVGIQAGRTRLCAPQLIRARSCARALLREHVRRAQKHLRALDRLRKLVDHTPPQTRSINSKIAHVVCC